MSRSLEGATRDAVAEILETIARDGLPGPRDLDVALDAIGGAIFDREDAAEQSAAAEARLPRVVLDFAPDGLGDVITDHACEVYCVSEHTPHDRVYQLSAAHRVSRDEVDARLGDSAIGSANDPRHPAVKARIGAFLRGERHLKPVTPTDEGDAQ